MSASNSSRISALEGEVKSLKDILQAQAKTINVLVNSLKEVKKDLKELKLVLKYRQGLRLVKNHGELAKVVYHEGATNISKNDAKKLRNLNRIAHVGYAFPKKTNVEYKDATKHLKHRASPGNQTSSVYKPGLTEDARRFKDLVNKGAGVPYGKKRKASAAPSPSHASAASASKSTGQSVPRRR